MTQESLNPHFELYFSNGHSDVVYFADSNFTEGQTEDYEYNYFGISNNFGNKNSLLFNSFEYDNETNLYSIGSTFYNPKIGLLLKNLNYGKESVPRAMQINIYPETINNIISNMMPVDGEPKEPMPPPLPAPFCGNGKKETNEQCDDGNTNDNDCCNTNCKDTGSCRPFKPSPTSKNCKWVVAQTSIIGVHIMICIPVEPQ